MSTARTNTTSRLRDGTLLGGLFVFALAVRLLYLWEGADSPTFSDPIVDAAKYHEIAVALVGRDALGQELFWQPLFYPLFLAAVYAVSGTSIVLAKLIQVLLGAATCVLTARLGRSVFDRATGLVAGTIVALYGPLIFFEAELLATGWACFWSVVLLLLLVDDGLPIPDARRGLLFGFVAGLAVVTRPTFLPFVTAAAIWFASPAEGRRRRLAATVIGFAIVALPAASLTAVKGERFSIVPASSGINLWIGNNPESAQTVALRPGWRWSELTRLPASHGVERRSETSHFFRRKVVDYVFADPAGFTAGLMSKTTQILGSRELPRNVDLYLYRDWSRVLQALAWKIGPFGFPYGLLLPLALVGGWLRRRSVPLPVWLFLGLYSASVVLVFVTARYRMPLVPTLSVFAAAGALAIVEMGRQRRWRSLAAGLGALIALAVATSLPGPFPQERADYRAEMLYLLGAKARQRGEPARALALLSEAIARDPDHGDAHNVLGNVHAQQGRRDLALAAYRRAVEVDPRNRVARDNFGRFLLDRGDYAEAIEQFEIVLRDEPADTALLRYYAMALQRVGRIDEAEAAFRRAQELEHGLAPKIPTTGESGG